MLTGGHASRGMASSSSAAAEDGQTQGVSQSTAAKQVARKSSFARPAHERNASAEASQRPVYDTVRYAAETGRRSDDGTTTSKPMAHSGTSDSKHRQEQPGSRAQRTGVHADTLPAARFASRGTAKTAVQPQRIPVDARTDPSGGGAQSHTPAPRPDGPAAGHSHPTNIGLHSGRNALHSGPRTTGPWQAQQRTPAIAAQSSLQDTETKCTPDRMRQLLQALDAEEDARQHGATSRLPSGRKSVSGRLRAISGRQPRARQSALPGVHRRLAGAAASTKIVAAAGPPSRLPQVKRIPKPLLQRPAG